MRAATHAQMRARCRPTWAHRLRNSPHWPMRLATLPAAEPASDAEVGDQGVAGGAPSQDETSASEAVVTPPVAAEPPDPSTSGAPGRTVPLSGDQARVVELPAPEGGAGNPPVEATGQSPPGSSPGTDDAAVRSQNARTRRPLTTGAVVRGWARAEHPGGRDRRPSAPDGSRSGAPGQPPDPAALEARTARADSPRAPGPPRGVGQADPRLRRRSCAGLRRRLSRARVSAFGLIATLRQSGLPGPEVRLLLDELRRFRVIGAALATTLHPVPAPSGFGPGLPYLQTEPAPVTARPYAAAASAEPPAAASRAGESPPGGGSDAPRPWSPAPMSASAGPGSAFYAAGLASLSALLIGLAAARAGERLRLSPGRGYMAVFLTPLDCPG